MAGGVDGRPGGIAGVCAELTEHGEAIEYDLLVIGRSLEDLGTDRLSWRDLWIVLTQAPRTSAYARSRLGEAALWGLAEHLIASVLDAVNAGNWQRGNQGRQVPTPRPRPVSRPGVQDDTQTFGSDPIKISEFNAWWESGN